MNDDQKIKTLLAGLVGIFVLSIALLSTKAAAETVTVRVGAFNMSANTHKALIKIDSLKEGDTVILDIMSFGGYVDELYAYRASLAQTKACVIAKPRVAMSSGATIIAYADKVDYSKLSTLLIHLPRTQGPLGMVELQFDQFDSFITPNFKFLTPKERAAVKAGEDLVLSGDTVRKRAANYDKDINMFSMSVNKRCK